MTKKFPTLLAWLQQLTGADAYTFAKGFAMFGYAIRKNEHLDKHSHGRNDHVCYHVLCQLRGTDNRKNTFVWDGVHHAQLIAACEAVLAYAKGQPFIPASTGAERLRRAALARIAQQKDEKRAKLN